MGIHFLSKSGEKGETSSTMLTCYRSVFASDTIDTAYCLGLWSSVAEKKAPLGGRLQALKRSPGQVRRTIVRLSAMEAPRKICHRLCRATHNSQHLQPIAGGAAGMRPDDLCGGLVCLLTSSLLLYAPKFGKPVDIFSYRISRLILSGLADERNRLKWLQAGDC